MNQDSQDPSSGNTPASVPEKDTTLTNLLDDLFSSTSEVSSSRSQQVGNFPTIAPPFSENTPASVQQHPTTSTSFRQNQPFSATTIIISLAQQARNFPTNASHYRTLFSGNTPAYVPEQPTGTASYIGAEFASTSQVSSFRSEQVTNFRTIAPRYAASSTGNIPAFVSEQPTGTASYSGAEFASTSQVSSFSSEQARNFPTLASYLTASSSGNTPASVPAQPTGTASFIGGEFASTSQASSFRSEQVRKFRTIAPRYAASSTGNIPAFVPEQSTGTASFVGGEFTSTSKTSISHSQQARKHFAATSPPLGPYDKSPSRNSAVPTSIFRTGPQQNLRISPSGVQATAVSLEPNTGALSFSFEITSPSKRQATAVSPIQNLEALSSSFELTSPSKRQATAVSPRQNIGALSSSFEITSPSKRQATAVSPIQNIGSPISSFEKMFPSKYQALAVSPRQNVGIPYSSFELMTPPKKEATGARPKQKAGTLSSSFELTPPSQKKVTIARPKSKTRPLSASLERTSESKGKATAGSLRNRSKTLSPSFNITSETRRKVVYATPRRLMWPTIPGEPKTPTTSSSISQQQSSASSLESPSKNPTSQQSTSVQGTEIDADRLKERLELFDKFTCVHCSAEFATQEELLNHGLIHFDD